MPSLPSCSQPGATRCGFPLQRDPELLQATAIAILVADPTREPTHWIARIGRPLFVMQVVIVTIVGFSVTNYRSESPPMVGRFDPCQGDNVPSGLSEQASEGAD